LTCEQSSERPHSESLLQKLPWLPEPMTPVQVPLAAPVEEMHR